MLDEIKLEDILFLDIETVPAAPEYSRLSERFQKLWDKKASQLKNSADELPENLYQRAGIYAEFGKIICIAVGFITQSGNEKNLRIKAFSGHDEKKILSDFFQLLTKRFNSDRYRLCAHNGKEFDYPYLCRRGLVNGLKLPRILDIAGKKPWEIYQIDTMDLWKFGDYKSYTSLDLLTAIFEIPTPKDDITGADVARVYWVENDLDRIVKYCCKDVLSIVQLYLRFQGENLLTNQQVAFVD